MRWLALARRRRTKRPPWWEPTAPLPPVVDRVSPKTPTTPENVEELTND